MTHTATPFILDETLGALMLWSKGHEHIISIEPKNLYPEREDDFRFIVTACNAYDSLLAQVRSSWRC